MEIFKNKKDGKDYLLVSCTSKQSDDDKYYWSTEIGVVKYKGGRKDGGKDLIPRISNNSIWRIVDISYGQDKGKTSFGKVVRCDAALSADGNYILIWSNGNKQKEKIAQFAIYSMQKLMDKLISKHKVSLKGIEPIKVIIQKGKDIVKPQGSFQGIELTNKLNMYMTSGKSKLSCKPLIFKLSVRAKIIGEALLNSEGCYHVEVEGIKISGDKLLVIKVMTRTKGQGRIYKIVSIDKGVL